MKVNATLQTALTAYRLRAEAAEARATQLAEENALLKRALAMLTRSLEETYKDGAAYVRSLEDAEAESTR